MRNPLLQLQTFGQSVWLDFISRRLIRSGDLRRLIDEDGIRGETSNPYYFEQAIGESHDYDDEICALVQNGKGPQEIYEILAVEDIRQAADLFLPVYDALQGSDGFVSFEVSPHLAYDTAGTLAEARKLWKTAGRPNLFIKVPATQAGLPAIRQLTSEGINMNITLLFGLSRYAEVMEAYIAGLEDRIAQRKPLDRLASVASFFLSRMDVLVDSMLDEIVRADGPKVRLAEGLRGQAAIASAKVAYRMYKETFHTERFRKLVQQGARPQRLVWASTGTKNPDYSDVKYVEPLIGPETVNTMPWETLESYRDHGNPAPRLEEGVMMARAVLRDLADIGIDLDAVSQRLEDEGVEKFVKPMDLLMKTLQERCKVVTASVM